VPSLYLSRSSFFFLRPGMSVPFLLFAPRTPTPGPLSLQVLFFPPLPVFFGTVKPSSFFFFSPARRAVFGMSVVFSVLFFKGISYMGSLTPSPIFRALILSFPSCGLFSFLIVPSILPSCEFLRFGPDSFPFLPAGSFGHHRNCSASPFWQDRLSFLSQRGKDQARSYLFLLSLLFLFLCSLISFLVSPRWFWPRPLATPLEKERSLSFPLRNENPVPISFIDLLSPTFLYWFLSHKMAPFPPPFRPAPF